MGIISREIYKHDTSDAVRNSDSSEYSCKDLAGCDDSGSSHNSGVSDDEC